MNALLRHLLVIVLLPCSAALAQQVTKVLNNGPDDDQLVCAVLGDGYAANDQGQFAQDVQDLVVNGVLGGDLYFTLQSGFNVYRVDLASADSGVSTPGARKNTALDTTFTGNIKDAWIRRGSKTDEKIDAALHSIGKYDLVLVLLHEARYGGCAVGNRLFVTAGSGSQVVAHEWGHGIGHLYDEYPLDDCDKHSGRLNNKNVSTVRDRDRVVWHDLIKPDTPVPTKWVSGMDKNRTVGMFEGADYCKTGVYRPVEACRMRFVDQPFCPVCEREMRIAMANYHHTSSSQPSPPIAALAAPPQANRTESHLHLIVRLKREGPPEVVQVKEIARAYSPASTRDANFVLESYTPEKPLGLEGFAQNPFIIRGIMPQGGGAHSIEQTDSVTVTLKIPNMTATEAMRTKIGLRLYSIAPNQDHAALGPDNMNALVREGGIKLERDFSADTLGPLIQKRLGEKP